MKGKQAGSSAPDDRGTKKIKEQSQRSWPGVYHRAGWHLSTAGCHGKTLEMVQREQEVFQSIAADKQEAGALLGRCQHPFSQNRCCHCPLFFVLVPVSSHRMHTEWKCSPPHQERTRYALKAWGKNRFLAILTERTEVQNLNPLLLAVSSQTINRYAFENPAFS